MLQVTRLVLIRHGESNATVTRSIGGPRSCNGLSPLGRQQAEALRDRWMVRPELDVDVLVTSHYQRAQETARIVAPALGEVELLVNAGFGEHDPGPDCDGLSFDEYTERHRGGLAAWEVGDPFAVTFPGGETVAAFQYRVGAALWQILGDHAGSTIVIVCHGGVVDTVMRLALKSPAMGGFEMHTANTSITELVVVRAGLWRLLRYNDSAHLAGLPSSTAVLVEGSA